MAALDPFDMLVRLGKISQANLQAADLVESGVGTSTRAARLVAIGVDKEKLLKDLSELTRMPIAPADVLASLAPMKLPASYSRAMKEMLAVPIGRVDEHILDVAIADPRTTTKLRDAAIAHRPHLALEADILAALARVFPEHDVLDPIAEPTLKNVPLAPRPVSVNEGAHEGAAHEGAAHEALSDEKPPPDLAPDVAAAHDVEPADVEPADVEPADVEPIAGHASPDERPPANLPPILDVAAEAARPREKPASPFAKTMVHTEVTERVRERHREGDEQPSEPSPASSSSFEQRVRAIVALVRERVAQADTTTRVTSAVIAVAVLVTLIALISFATSDDDDTPIVATPDAGVAPVVDAGDANASQLSTTPPAPPVVEKPKKPKKQKRKPSRTKRKTPR